MASSLNKICKSVSLKNVAFSRLSLQRNRKYVFSLICCYLELKTIWFVCKLSTFNNLGFIVRKFAKSWMIFQLFHWKYNDLCLIVFDLIQSLNSVVFCLLFNLQLWTSLQPLRCFAIFPRFIDFFCFHSYELGDM